MISWNVSILSVELDLDSCLKIEGRIPSEIGKLESLGEYNSLTSPRLPYLHQFSLVFA
jgi:hypothetical protein